MRHRKATLTIEGMPLVTVPVGIANTRPSKNGDIGLSIVFPDGRRAKTVYVNEATGETAESRPATRGVKIGTDAKGDLYGLVDMEAWKQLDASIRLHIIGFVDRTEVLARIDRVEGAHFVQVQKGYDASALGMILQGLERNESAAVVRFAVGTKERIGVMLVRPDRALVVLTVTWADGMTAPDADVLAPAEAEVAPAAVEQVERLIETYLIDGAMLDKLTDEVTPKRRALVEAAVRGEAVITTPVEEAPTPAVDLAAAIGASLDGLKPAEAKPKSKRKAKAKAA